MATKRESISDIPTDYLRRLANQLNSKRQNYEHLSRDDLLNRVTNRLTVDQIQEIRTIYNEDGSPWDAASRVSPDGPREIRDTLEQYFGANGIYEVKIGRRRCDLCFPANIVAIEIKSGHDRIAKAAEQVSYYSGWANKVYLAFSKEHERKIHEIPIMPNVGLIMYDSKRVTVIREATKLCIRPEVRLRFMTYDYIASIAKDLNIGTKGGKRLIANRIARQLSEEKIEELFKQYLDDRS